MSFVETVVRTRASGGQPTAILSSLVRVAFHAPAASNARLAFSIGTDILKELSWDERMQLVLLEGTGTDKRSVMLSVGKPGFILSYYPPQKEVSNGPVPPPTLGLVSFPTARLRFHRVSGGVRPAEVAPVRLHGSRLMVVMPDWFEPLPEGGAFPVNPFARVGDAATASADHVATQKKA